MRKNDVCMIFIQLHVFRWKNNFSKKVARVQ